MGTLVVNDKALYDDLYLAAKSIGGCPSPFDCYLALRGVKTLATRVKCKNIKFLNKNYRINQKCLCRC